MKSPQQLSQEIIDIIKATGNYFVGNTSGMSNDGTVNVYHPKGYSISAIAANPISSGEVIVFNVNGVWYAFGEQRTVIKQDILIQRKSREITIEEPTIITLIQSDKEADNPDIKYNLTGNQKYLLKTLETLGFNNSNYILYILILIKLANGDTFSDVRIDYNQVAIIDGQGYFHNYGENYLVTTQKFKRETNRGQAEIILKSKNKETKLNPNNFCFFGSPFGYLGNGIYQSVIDNGFSIIRNQVGRANQINQILGLGNLGVQNTSFLYPTTNVSDGDLIVVPSQGNTIIHNNTLFTLSGSATANTVGGAVKTIIKDGITKFYMNNKYGYPVRSITQQVWLPNGNSTFTFTSNPVFVDEPDPLLPPVPPLNYPIPSDSDVGVVRTGIYLHGSEQLPLTNLVFFIFTESSSSGTYIDNASGQTVTYSSSSSATLTVDEYPYYVEIEGETIIAAKYTVSIISTNNGATTSNVQSYTIYPKLPSEVAGTIFSSGDAKEHFNIAGRAFIGAGTAAMATSYYNNSLGIYRPLFYTITPRTVMVLQINDENYSGYSIMKGYSFTIPEGSPGGGGSPPVEQNTNKLYDVTLTENMSGEVIVAAWQKKYITNSFDITRIFRRYKMTVIENSGGGNYENIFYRWVDELSKNNQVLKLKSYSDTEGKNELVLNTKGKFLILPNKPNSPISKNTTTFSVTIPYSEINQEINNNQTESKNLAYPNLRNNYINEKIITSTIIEDKAYIIRGNISSIIKLNYNTSMRFNINIQDIKQIPTSKLGTRVIAPFSSTIVLDNGCFWNYYLSQVNHPLILENNLENKFAYSDVSGALYYKHTSFTEAVNLPDLFLTIATPENPNYYDIICDVTLPFVNTSPVTKAFMFLYNFNNYYPPTYILKTDNLINNSIFRVEDPYLLLSPDVQDQTIEQVKITRIPVSEWKITSDGNIKYNNTKLVDYKFKRPYYNPTTDKCDADKINILSHSYYP